MFLLLGFLSGTFAVVFFTMALVQLNDNKNPAVQICGCVLLLVISVLCVPPMLQEERQHQQKQQNTIMSRGEKAYRDGVPADECPYLQRHGYVYARYWLKGWMKAKREEK